MPGEFDLISWIRARQRASDFVQLAAGDDLAVLKWNHQDLLLVGTDQVLDGVHFDSKVHSPRSIGKKAMNRNLSDCAAMACLPAAAVATVALPLGASMEYAKDLYLGMQEAGEAFDCQIVGGDTAAWDGKLVVTVSIIARTAGMAPVTRSGARVGQLIQVTGPLGGSIRGRHMTFSPRVHEGVALGRAGVTAMIDISDGLSRDLRHICEQSRVGAIIDASAIPIHNDARELHDNWSPLEHALHDGEDHELLFTSHERHRECFVIGRVTFEPGIFLEQDGQRTLLEPKGWEHTF
jgi:thiamine-monophosphate kinase